jgi:signal transduction histidine kinase/ligand-binding sensor domain-containing protein
VRQGIRRRLVMLFASALFVGTVAAGPSRPWTLQHYTHTALTPADDNRVVNVAHITQAADGLLWLDTAQGLTRFDGDRFIPFLPMPGEAFPGPDIADLFAPSTGGVWASFRGRGLSFIDHGHITNYLNQPGTTDVGAKFFEDRSHRVLLYGPTVGFLLFEKGQWKPTDIKPPGRLHLLAYDTDFNLWVVDSHEGRIWVLHEGATRFTDTGTVIPRALGISVPSRGLVCVDTQAHVIQRFQAVHDRLTEIGEPIPFYSRTIVPDLRGGGWTGTGTSGIAHFDQVTDLLNPGKFSAVRSEIIDQSSGLINDAVPYVFQDREGNIWGGGGRGLDRFTPSAFSRLSLPPHIHMITLAAGTEGDVWIGSESNNVVHYVNDVAIVTNAPLGAMTMTSDARDGTVFANGLGDIWQLQPGVPHKLASIPRDASSANMETIFSLARDRDFRLWTASTSPNVRIDMLTHDGWQERADIGQPSRLIPVPSGRIWAAYPDGRKLAFVDHDIVTQLDQTNDLVAGRVKTITEFDGVTWVGGDAGVQMFRDGKFYPLTLPNNGTLESVTGIVRDREGAVWVHSPEGLSRLLAGDIAKFLANPAYKPPYLFLGIRDGAPGIPSQSHSLPSLVLGSDGRLWVEGGQEAAWVNPADLPPRPVPYPPIVIELANGANRRDLRPANVKIPDSVRDLQITYTAPDLASGTTLHFQTKLDGFDDAWQDAGNRHTAVYPHLKAGHYEFSVRAAHEGGPWITSTLPLRFAIAPYFYETWWFYILCMVLALLVLWGLVRIQILRATARVHARMQIRIDERESVARDLHDTLLQSTQGLALQLQGLSMKYPQSDVRADLHHLARMTNDAVAEGRDRVRALRATGGHSYDMSASLCRIGRELGHLHEVEFQCVCKGRVRWMNTLSGSELQLLLSEALANAFHHANASHIRLEMAFGMWRFTASVKDDGVGIDPDVARLGGPEGHWGLIGMRERAVRIGGHLKVGRRPSGGTEVFASMSARRIYASRKANASN